MVAVTGHGPHSERLGQMAALGREKWPADQRRFVDDRYRRNAGVAASVCVVWPTFGLGGGASPSCPTPAPRTGWFEGLSRRKRPFSAHVAAGILFVLPIVIKTISTRTRHTRDIR